MVTRVIGVGFSSVGHCLVLSPGRWSDSRPRTRAVLVMAAWLPDAAILFVIGNVTLTDLLGFSGATEVPIVQVMTPRPLPQLPHGLIVALIRFGAVRV